VLRCDQHVDTCGSGRARRPELSAMPRGGDCVKIEIRKVEKIEATKLVNRQ
jgi:hypothetical protein